MAADHALILLQARSLREDVSLPPTVNVLWGNCKSVLRDGAGNPLNRNLSSQPALSRLLVRLSLAVSSRRNRIPSANATEAAQHQWCIAGSTKSRLPISP